MVSGYDSEPREGMSYVVEITTPHCNGGHSVPTSYANARHYQMLCERVHHNAVIHAWSMKE